MRWAVGAGVVLVVVPVLLFGTILGLVSGGQASTVQPGGVPSEYALADIPPEYLAWYTYWTRECPGLSWAVVAAIGKIESDHGRSTLPGVRSRVNSHGAAGPMQFGVGGQAGDTWAAYGLDGDLPPDGVADVYHAPDAIRAAFGYLCAHGAGRPGGVRGAVLAYNHDRGYVDRVLALAGRYGTPVAAADAGALLANPRARFTPAARADLEAGVIDARVISILAALAERHPITVSVLKTGHSRYVAGSRRESHHYHGRAADISEIGGQPVSAGNPAAREAVAWLASLSGPLRPDEVGSPFSEFSSEDGHFNDESHENHIHAGYGAE